MSPTEPGRGMLPLDEPLPMEGRATFLPFRDAPTGREWALPGMLAGAWNAFTAPGRAARGMLDPQSHEAVMEALNLAGYPLLVGAPALAAARPPLPGMLGVNVFHGSSRPGVKLKDLDPRHAVETKGAVFFTDNPDVADIFRYPREYGEVLFDQPRGSLVKADVNFKNPMELRGAEAQRFTDDTVFQGEMVRSAKAKGHDGIIVRDVKEGVGDVTERGTTYVAFDRSAYLKPAVRETYVVTVTPKFQSWNNKPFTVEVQAATKAEATARARRMLESEGHVFTHSDAASFRAERAPSE